MKRLLLAVIALFCIALFNSLVQACTCAESGTPMCARYERSDVIFIGRLESIKPLKNPPLGSDRYNALHFVVEESYKAVKGKRVVVGTSVGTTCSLTFTEGTRYLVFASQDNETHQLFTGMCTGTGEANFLSAKALDFLRKARRHDVPESLSGKVKQDFYMDVKGLTVRLIGANKQVTTKTDESGSYTFSLPGPGKYKVQVLVPYAVAFEHFLAKPDVREEKTDSLSTLEYSVTLGKNECHYLELGIHTLTGML